MRSFLLIISLLAPAALIVACESTSSVSKLAEMAPKDLFSGYTQNLGDLGGLLKGVGDSQSAAMALPKAKDLVNNLGAYAEKIQALPPGQVDSLMQEYGPKIEPAMTMVDEQIARLSQNPTYGSALSTALRNIPTLK
jgi:hypothetical protein